MTNCLKAIFFSLVAHCFVAFGLAFCIGHAPTIEVPLLDLSAVELSFAEEERESPAVPPPVSDTPPPPPEPDTPPPPPEPDTPQPPPEPDTPPPPPEPDTPPPSPEPDTPPPPEPDTPPPPEPDTPQPPPEPDTPPPPEPDTSPPPPVSDTPPPSPVSDIPPTNEETTKRLNEQTEQARVDAPPKPLKSIKPDYPKGARQRGEEGDVALELAINARGGVDSVTVVASSGYPELDAAALRAATKARFVPAKVGKNAISSVARITISFRLTAR